MLTFIRIIGVAVIILSIIYLIYPNAIRRFIHFCIDNRLIFLGGILRIVIGVLILLSASSGQIPSILLILGILILTSGIIVFLAGANRVKNWLTSLTLKSNLFLRFMSVIGMLLGCLLLLSA